MAEIQKLLGNYKLLSLKKIRASFVIVHVKFFLIKTILMLEKWLMICNKYIKQTSEHVIFSTDMQNFLNWVDDCFCSVNSRNPLLICNTTMAEDYFSTQAFALTIGH